MKIGVLDIQGSVKEHVEALKRLKIEPVLVKNVFDLGGVKGLIIPGGESTTLGKLLKKFGLDKAIVERAKMGMPVWGTCAGAILLANDLGLLDISVERNAYGRQLDSFEAEVKFGNKRVPGIFIRAPKISNPGKNVKILGLCRGEIVAVREKDLLATTFHPELTEDLSIHRYFVKMCEEN